MKFDASAAWNDAKRMLAGQREILLTLTGFFIFMPNLFLATLRPFEGAAATIDELLASYEQWVSANIVWLALSMLLAALGRAAMLILLTANERPTVGEALRVAVGIVPILVLADILAFVPVLFGFTLFLLPGLYLAGRLALVEVALVDRRMRNPVAALAASWQATSGNGWRLAITFLLIIIGTYLLQAVIGLILGIVFGLLAGREAGSLAVLLVGTATSAALQLAILLVATAAWRQLALSR